MVSNAESLVYLGRPTFSLPERKRPSHILSLGRILNVLILVEDNFFSNFIGSLHHKVPNHTIWLSESVSKFINH